MRTPLTATLVLVITPTVWVAKVWWSRVRPDQIQLLRDHRLPASCVLQPRPDQPTNPPELTVGWQPMLGRAALSVPIDTLRAQFGGGGHAVFVNGWQRTSTLLSDW